MKDVMEKEIIRQIQGGLFGWYKFHENAKILYIGKEEDAYIDFLRERDIRLSVVSWEDFETQTIVDNKYDYVLCVAYPERAKELGDVLLAMKGILVDEGHLLLAMNNRLGMRFLCGDRDPYTRRVMDGVEGYAQVAKTDAINGRCYSKAEIKDCLKTAGMERYEVFSVLSDLQNPTFLFAEDYLPNEDLSTRVFPTYEYPNSVFMEEATLYGSFVKEGIFHQLCNAFLFDYSKSGNFSNVLHVTASMERAKKDAMFTIIRRDQKVEKRAAFLEGRKRLEEIAVHDEELIKNGIAVVGGELTDGAYVSPFMDYQVGQLYLKELLRRDKVAFLQEMDHFRDILLASSKHVKEDVGDGEGVILEKAFFDMVPLNSFYVDGEFVFFDQEFCMENYPANVLIWRLIASFYFGDPKVEKLLPMQEMIERYGLKEKLIKWQQMEFDFLRDLRNETILAQYHNACWKTKQIMLENRVRMNYSSREYQKLFVDIFKNANEKKLVLFGSGAFARDFLTRYHYDYEVTAIVDNQESRQGEMLDNVPIISPKDLGQMAGDVKVIVCVKNYAPILMQLKQLGIVDVGVYEKGKKYPWVLQRTNSISQEKNGVETKKYHIGYVAGAFDMFHVGHLNLIRKAKEMCDFLIVGVLPDEGIYRLKQKYPIIPCEDRVEIIRACKYADRVEALPVEQMGIEAAYDLFHFDAQFSGDDHANNASWLASREYLRERGSDIVFFNYTEKVSSTMLRKQRNS